jgi:hypothetical protein
MDFGAEIDLSPLLVTTYDAERPPVDVNPYCKTTYVKLDTRLSNLI